MSDVHLGHQVVDDADLVADLGSAEDRHKRLLRMAERLAQVFQFLLHQQAGGVLLDEVGDAFGGSVGAMRRSERVVHVVVAELGELPGELGIVGFLFRVEAQVLEQQRLSLFQLGRHLFGLRADAVGREADVLAAAQNFVEQDAQALGHRLQAHLRIGLALGTAQVRGQNQARAVTQRVLDGGQGFADAGVVHHPSVVERNVEVHPHEDSFAAQRKITNR